MHRCFMRLSLHTLQKTARFDLSPSLVACQSVCFASTSQQNNNNSGSFSQDSSESNRDADIGEDPWWMGRRLWRSDNLSPFTITPQAWVQSMDTLKARNVGLIDLHPEVFRAPPRLDILKRNLNWQDDYRKVVLTKSISRGEMVGGGRKPWPQKKSGRARAGSIRAPFFFRGGLSKGVRGPLTYFYMLPYADRIHGLCIALTIKHMQDDLVIVDSLDNIPLHDEIGNTEFQRTEHNHSMCDEALRLHEIADVRNWGYSVLFVDAKDVAPRNLALACQDIPTFNMLPTYGLNCQSMMKHDTLVMTVDAVHIIENQLLKGMHRAQRERYQYKNFKQRIIEEGAEDDDEPGASRPPNVIW